MSPEQVGKKRQADVDTFCITRKGLDMLAVTDTYTDPCLLMSYLVHEGHEGADFSQFATFELMLELKKRGWVSEKCNPRKKADPFVFGSSEKKWFYGKTINKNYLQVLLRAEQLSQAGFHIFHFQRSTYYKAVLSLPGSMLEKIKPWQPHSFYKVLLQKAKLGKDGNPRHGRHVFEEDAGRPFLLLPLHFTCPQPVATGSIDITNYTIILL